MPNTARGYITWSRAFSIGNFSFGVNGDVVGSRNPFIVDIDQLSIQEWRNNAAYPLWNDRDAKLEFVGSAYISKKARETGSHLRYAV